MLFLGNSFCILPENPQLSFAFNNILINNTGNSFIGFSGSGNNILRFLFSGNKIFSPENKICGHFNTGEIFNISGFIDTTDYGYYINDDLIDNQITKTNYNLQKLLVNLTGTTLSADIVLSCPPINYDILLNDNFIATNNLSGSIINNSASKIRVFSKDITYFQSLEPVLSGNVSGVINRNSSLNFSLSDLNDSLFDSSIDFLLDLHSNIGTLSKEFSVNRVSGMDQIVRTLTTNSGDLVLSGLFYGSGDIPNTFTFINQPESVTQTYYVSSSNLRGQPKSSTISIQLDSFNPSSGFAYRSDYITGFTITNSGHYQYVPTPIFTGYYYVDGLDYSLSTILLSSGCSGSIPIIFSGVNGGSGASGNLKTNRVLLNGVYDVGTNPYYIPSAFQMMSGGTGYVQSPVSIVKTGIYANCRDVAANYGYNSFGFQPFNGLGKLIHSALYLTGEVAYQTGFMSGDFITGSGAGYRISGLRITNDGSGFNQTLYPRVVFRRDARDVYTGNASGTFSLKQSGLYDFTQWGISTGFAGKPLTGMNSYSGQTTLDPTNNYVTIQVSVSGDHTQPLISQLSVSMVGGNTIYTYITGTQFYITDSGLLKKKNNLDPILFNEGANLSFLTTQDDLDNLYSSDGFINSPAPDFGDLDFG